MRYRKPISLFTGCAVTAVFLWLVFRNLPFQEFLEALQSADPQWILIGLAFFAAGYLCRIWRWRQMLVQFNTSLSLGRCSVPFMISIAANNVLPFRAGDVLRGVAFAKWLGVPTARVLATLLVERLLDLLSLILALALALRLLSTGQMGLQSLFGWSAWGLFAIACAIGLFLLFSRLFERPVNWAIRRLLWRNQGLSNKIEEQIDHVFQTLASLANRTRMAKLMFWSLTAWACEACVFYAVARSLPDITEPIVAWLAMPVGTLSTMLPSTPGYIGTFHFFVIQVTEALGNPEIAAAAFAFLVHLALFIPATLWGGACFVYWIVTRRGTQLPQET